MDAILFPPGEGETLEIAGSRVVFKATAETTGGAFSLSETRLPAGMKGPPPHRHRHTVDTFYVLEGTLRMQVGDREVDAPAGTYVLVPPGVLHTFSNPAGTAVRFLNITAPGGWENYLRDLAAAAEAGAIPGGEEFARIVARYDFDVSQDADVAHP